MSEGKDDIRFERMTKENKLVQKQQKVMDNVKSEAGMKRISKRNKLQTEQKKRIMHLNITQMIILVIVIFIEVLSIYGYISEVFSIIGLIILCASCVIIMKKIKKTLQL